MRSQSFSGLIVEALRGLAWTCFGAFTVWNVGLERFIYYLYLG